MRQERGFALLLVFVMAAAIAITLYKELPRVAFEAQRSKEQELINHGEQYIRAIQLYVRKVKSYPISIEQLEGTSGQIRYLRKRYDDPMTGKNEWRLIHIGPGGVYTDSLVHKPPAAKQEEKSVNTFTYQAAPVGSTLDNGATDSAVPLQRPSERAGMPMPGQQQPVNPSDPQAAGQPQAGAQTPPGLGAILGLPPGVSAPPQGANPQQSANGQAGVQVANNTGQAVAGSDQSGTTPNPAAPPGQNQALDLINSMLRQPRTAPQATGQAQGMQIGAGSIAGIASKVERKGIKIYREMGKYNEWEFLYDMTQDQTGVAGGAVQQLLTPQSGQAGQTGQINPGQTNPTQQPAQPQQPMPIPPVPTQ